MGFCCRDFLTLLLETFGTPSIQFQDNARFKTVQSQDSMKSLKNLRLSLWIWCLVKTTHKVTGNKLINGGFDKGNFKKSPLY